MLTSDDIMFGIVIFGFAAWFAVYGFEWLWSRRKRRILLEQIKGSVVPVEYSRVVKMLAAEYNIESSGFTTDAQDARHGELNRLRHRVSIIRVKGFDAGVRNKAEPSETFADGIEHNPYDKGTGEAKQWARGYCMATGQQPKGWMKIA